VFDLQQAIPSNALTASPAALGSAEWARFISVAWAVDPALAIAVWQRFRRSGAPHVDAAASRCVLADPAAVRMLPGAVELLLTPEAVASSIPQLRQLLVWTPAAMSVVLGLLSRCSHIDASIGTAAGAAPGPFRSGAGVAMCAHPLVAAYIVRCLRRFTAETVVFYLPQLVQV
jgi:hypothetical protein